MYKSLTAATVALCLSACAQQAPVVSTGKLTPTTVCGDVGAVMTAPDGGVRLDAFDPHSAIGVLWADVKAACPGGQPAAGVDASWTSMVWSMLVPLLAQAVPAVMALL